MIERAGEEMQTAGRSWADIVGSQNLSHGAVPLPHTRFGARVARPNSVVLHTQAFKDITVREVMDAVLKCVRQDTITVDAMEVLIKYCMNSFPQVDQFIRIQISFYFLCVSYWSIGSETKSNWLI